METKRKENLKGLKVKFLGATDCLSARIKFIETNTRKTKTVNYNYNCDVLETAYNILDKNDNVISYNLVVDNTQNDFYLFSIKTKDFEKSLIDGVE